MCLFVFDYTHLKFQSVNASELVRRILHLGVVFLRCARGDTLDRVLREVQVAIIIGSVRRVAICEGVLASSGRATSDRGRCRAHSLGGLSRSRIKGSRLILGEVKLDVGRVGERV